MEPEKNVVASLALHAVLEPVFKELEADDKNIAAVQTLRNAFAKAERAHPGLTEDFIGGVLEAELMRDKLSLPESLLRLALNDLDQYTLASKEDEFIQLNFRAKALKQKLSHIPEEIKDRSKFLLIIRHIASAIKDVLDAVNEVSQSHRSDPRMSREHRKLLDSRKRVFVKSSRSFSDTLKKYFKTDKQERHGLDSRPEDDVFLSANRLINHTNALLGTYKALGY